VNEAAVPLPISRLSPVHSIVGALTLNNCGVPMEQRGLHAGTSLVNIRYRIGWVGTPEGTGRCNGLQSTPVCPNS